MPEELQNHQIDWFPFDDETEEKIASFRDAKPGWHYGEGDPPKESVLITALRLHESARDAGFVESNAFLGTSGEIQVILFSGNDSFEFTVEPDGTITFYHERNKIVLEENEGIDLHKAIAKVSEHRSWSYFDSLNFVAGSPSWEDFPALNLSPPLVTQEFQWSQSNALRRIAAIQANAPVKGLGVSMRNSDLNPLFSGDLNQERFQPVAA